MIEQNIVSLFQKNKDEFLSGEKISADLGVSRASVWKYIKKLRRDGFEIEAFPRNGYRLKSIPDKLYGNIVGSNLDTQIIGKKAIYHYEDIDSTNNKAYELADKGGTEGTIVFAEKQSHGKGRMGRFWASPTGGIYMSIILRPEVEPAKICALTLAVAVSVAKAIDNTCGTKSSIKWPNDILIEGKKVSGILTEIKAEPDKIEFLILGIGINVNVNLNKLPKASAVLRADRIKIVQSVLKEIEKVYYQFLKKGFVSIRDECKALSCVIGKTVEINVSAGFSSKKGTAIDIDENGALVIKTGDGKIKHIFSGDVILSEYKKNNS